MGNASLLVTRSRPRALTGWLRAEMASAARCRRHRVHAEALLAVGWILSRPSRARVPNEKPVECPAALGEGSVRADCFRVARLVGSLIVTSPSLLGRAAVERGHPPCCSHGRAELARCVPRRLGADELRARLMRLDAEVQSSVGNREHGSRHSPDARDVTARHSRRYATPRRPHLLHAIAACSKARYACELARRPCRGARLIAAEFALH